MTRICFLNPFGTDQFDELVQSTLTPYLRAGTDVEFRHLSGCPRNIDYYVPKHLVEVEVLRAVAEADREGFDAFVIGCCYDPALTQARELTDMPVVGPLEASVLLARLFGHRFSVVTDHRKAVPELEDRVRLYGVEPNCRSVRAIDWFVEDMVQDPAAVARDAHRRCLETMEEDRCEAIVLGCTIIAACYERTLLDGTGLGSAAIINPNVMGVKVAELFADLRAVGQYRIGRALPGAVARRGGAVSLRVVVVGGGIVGAATAYFAAREGARVTLLEREHVAFGASGRNPGFVWLHCRNPGFALEISLATRRLYPQLAAELPIDFEFRESGGLIYFLTGEQASVFTEFTVSRRADGLDVELIDGGEVRRLVPPIRPDVLGATFCAQDAHINTPLLVRALAEGARAEGAEIEEGVAVTGLLRAGEDVVGVETERRPVEADVVVAAAGVWTAQLLQTIGIDLALGAERLQVIATDPLAPLVEPLVYGPLATKQYALFRDLPSYDVAAFTAPYEDEWGIEMLQLLAQRANGELLLGCPMDYPTELDLRPTLAGLAATAIAISEDFPGLRDVPVARTWAGLLPYTSDTIPVIDTPVPGLYVASGHVYGNSAGPMTGKLLAQLVMGREPELDVSECRFDRTLSLPAVGTAARW
jgi:glycine/D-amino acid oxidase-like deaminating enzyme/Asp/Glu/hydantoin racemase